MDYTEAIAVLERAQDKNEKFEFPVKWGIDLQSEHERYLTEKHAKKPVIVMNYPKDIKAFYMRVNDDGKTVAAMDVLAPGIGEIIGGSQREERLDVLDARMAERGTRQGALRLVPRPAPLRHRAPRRLRPRLRAHPRLRHRPRQCARRDPVPADARECAVLKRSALVESERIPESVVRCTAKASEQASFFTPRATRQRASRVSAGRPAVATTEISAVDDGTWH